MTDDQQFVERSFDTGQVVIDYAETGGSGTPLLLLHGATLTWHSFDEFLPTLSGSWPIYACNLRGHGGSGWTGSGYRIGDFAGDIASFLANRIGQPAILIGYSMGADVAIQVAATLPRLVTAAILIEPGLALRELAFTDAVDPEIYDYATWVYETVNSNLSTEQIMRRWLERNDAAGVDPPPDIEEARGPKSPHSRPSIRDMSTTSCTTASTTASTSKTHFQGFPVRPSFSAANPSSAHWSATVIGSSLNPGSPTAAPSASPAVAIRSTGTSPAKRYSATSSAFSTHLLVREKTCEGPLIHDRPSTPSPTDTSTARTPLLTGKASRLDDLVKTTCSRPQSR